MKKKEYKDHLNYLQEVNNALEQELSEERDAKRRLDRATGMLERILIAAIVVAAGKWVIGDK